MRGRPDRWALLAFFVLIGAGAAALLLGGGVQRSEREAQYFQGYVICRTVFDCTSAVCGAGFLLGDWAGQYTPRGRWLLTALGVAGMLVYLAAVVSALRRIGTSALAFRIPGAGTVVLAAVLWLVVSVGVLTLVSLAGEQHYAWSRIAQTALGAGGGFALGDPVVRAAFPTTVVLLGWAAAAGWPLWLLLLPHVFRRCVAPRALLALAAAHVVLLILLAGFATAVEQRSHYYGVPLGATQPAEQPTTLTRFGDHLRDLAARNGAGVALHDTGAPYERDAVGVVAARALAPLLGGVAFGPIGGIGVLLLLWAVVGAWTNGRGPAAASREFTRWTHAALNVFAGYMLLVVLGALGLLLIDALVTTGYVAPPTFAIALQDASAAVSGSGAFSGLVPRLSDATLTGGIGQPVDLFWIAMGWVAVLLLAGRVWLLRVLTLFAAARES